MFNLDSFLEKNLPILKGLARHYNFSVHDAEDLAANVLLDFVKKYRAGRIDTSKNPTGYLNNLARWRITDKAREHIRAAKNFSQIGENNDLDELISAEKQDQSEILDLAFEEVKKIKHKRKHGFANRDCEIFKAAVFEGLSAEEIAQKMNTTTSTVYLSKHRVGKMVIKIAKELNGI